MKFAETAGYIWDRELDIQLISMYTNPDYRVVQIVKKLNCTCNILYERIAYLRTQGVAIEPRWKNPKFHRAYGERQKMNNLLKKHLENQSVASNKDRQYAANLENLKKARAAKAAKRANALAQGSYTSVSYPIKMPEKSIPIEHVRIIKPSAPMPPLYGQKKPKLEWAAIFILSAILGILIALHFNGVL